jgi:hypothetical protein
LSLALELVVVDDQIAHAVGFQFIMRGSAATGTRWK